MPLLVAEHHWECPNCTHTDVTHEQAPHTRFHACAGLKGLTAPMVPAGTRCKIEAREREDYVGGELIRTDGDGRPVMSVVTTRDDGQDCAIYAPCATAGVAAEGLSGRVGPGAQAAIARAKEI
jgi:hypothetical protein